MSDLHLGDHPTQKSVATQVAVAAQADSKPHLGTTTHMQPGTTAGVHHSALHKAAGVWVCRVDRACAELVREHGVLVQGIPVLVVAWSATRQHGVWGYCGAQNCFARSIRSAVHDIRIFASIASIRLPPYFRQSVELGCTRSPRACATQTTSCPAD